MAKITKSKVFRVTGFPIDKAELDIQSEINSLLEDDEREYLNVKVASIPSCDVSDTSSALVEFKGGHPKFLSHLESSPLSDYPVEMKDRDINFDCHFFGFTQLYATAQGQPINADIVAITGLDGSAYGSWRAKGSLSRMWLRDFFSKDLPNCRTMIYGYNSKLSSHGIDTIMDYGREFLEAIKRIRNTKMLRERPLFFIAHSFGGLILAHCLVKAIQTDERDHPSIAALHKSTYGILFFGTPHKGLVIDDILRMMEGDDSHPRHNLLEQIKHTSDILIHQLADFKNLTRDYKIVSFYETQQTQRLELDPETKAWGRTGAYITAVDSDSALLQLPDSLETKVKVDADHSRIVKFESKNNETYKTALGYLKQFEKDAQKTIQDRFAFTQRKVLPTSTVPFGKDPDFIGRTDILDQLDSIFETNPRAAIYGLGGMGKSQIAIEYSYQVRDRYPEQWVFWVHAGCSDRFLQAYQEIARVVELPGCDDPKADVLRLVYSWLREKQNGPWLMILDNVDDSSVLMKPPTSSTSALIKSIPQVSHGKILVTSRDRIAASDVVGNYKCLVPINCMNDNESLELLKAKLSLEPSPEDCWNLVKILDRIPLAVTQACAYINQHEPLMMVSTYLVEFSGNQRNQKTLLEYNAADLRRDPNVPNAVITTWELSFALIKKKYPPAADLLSLMCMFDRQRIPDFLLQQDNDYLNFTASISPLINFSMVKSETKYKSFELHRLVQLATRTWLKSNNQVQNWENSAIKRISEVFPTGEFENWTICDILIPHVEAILGYTPTEKKTQLAQIQIFYYTSWYLYRRGNLILAKQRARAALWGKHYFEDFDNLRTDWIQQILGDILHDQGRWEEAEELKVQVMETRKRVSGQEHPSTLISIGNLALTYQNQGRWKEAEKLEVQVMETRKRVSGQEHPSTLISIGNLASTYRNQGQWKKAEELEVQVMETFKRVLGQEHPDTLTSIGNLALTYQNQGRWKEAEELEVQVIEMRKRVSGQEHPSTLTSIACLASTYRNQGRWKEAEKLEVQVMETFKRILGQEHPSTLISTGNLALTYQNQGRWKKAEELGMQVMETFKRVLGQEHPDTLTSIGNLASTYRNQGQWKKAEGLEVQVIETVKRVLGQEHPSTLISIGNLASTYRNQGQWKKAEELEVQVMETFKRVLGQEHPSTLISIGNLALTYQNQGRWKKAEELEVQVMETFKRVLGQEHPSTLISIGNLTSTYRNQGQWKKVEELEMQVMETRKRVSG